MKMNIDKNSTISTLAYVVIIIAGLKLGSGFIVPFLMAFFLFIIFLPLANKLNSFSIPNVITSLIIFSIIIVIVFLLGTFLKSSSDDIVKNIPLYQDKFHQASPKIIAFFAQFNISLEKNNIINLIEPAKIINYTTSLFKGMGNIVVSLFLTLLLFIFLLLESSTIFQKALYFTKTEKQKKQLLLFLNNINRYFIIKTLTSLLTGLLVWIVLKYFNLQYALLFAIIAFLLNYIPTIGSFIASFPAIFVAVFQLSIIDTVMIAIGYLVINIMVGSFLEPKIMGKNLGLSTSIVFISMIVWGWIFGPFGMLLAVPLTVFIKAACEQSEHYYGIFIALSDVVKKDEEIKREV